MHKLIICIFCLRYGVYGSTDSYIGEFTEFTEVTEFTEITENSLNEYTTIGPKFFEPTWDSLDSRQLPDWFDKAKIGIFIHWGVYSVPGYGTEWFWSNFKNGRDSTIKFMEKNYAPNFTYQDFGPQFKTEFFDPDYWADIFQKAGAKYIVLTSKHHEGYTLWPSKYSFSWNAMDIGPKRDLVGDLAKSIRNKTDLKFGLYHSLYEWFNPLFLSDKEKNFTSDEFVQMKVLPSLHEIVEEYKPEILWSDGEWEAKDTYWKAKEFLAWLFNDSPVRNTVVVNDRWGSETLCKHGDFYTCADRYNPGVLQPHKWENCFTLDRRSWGYRRNSKYEDYMSPESLIRTIVESVSCGGNVLVNIGPTKEGTLPPIMVERLLQMGQWLSINGEAIYETTPHSVQNDTLTPGVWYTAKPVEKRIFAIVTKIEAFAEGSLLLTSISGEIVDSVQLLGSNDTLEWWEKKDGGISITLPKFELINLKWAWTFVINTK